MHNSCIERSERMPRKIKAKSSWVCFDGNFTVYSRAAYNPFQYPYCFHCFEAIAYNSCGIPTTITIYIEHTLKISRISVEYKIIFMYALLYHHKIKTVSSIHVSDFIIINSFCFCDTII